MSAVPAKQLLIQLIELGLMVQFKASDLHAVPFTHCIFARITSDEALKRLRS